MLTIRLPRLEPDSAWRGLPAWKWIADCAALRAAMYYPKDQEKRDAFLETVESVHVLEAASWAQQPISSTPVQAFGRALWAVSPEQTLAAAEGHVEWCGEFVGRALIFALREKKEHGKSV